MAAISRSQAMIEFALDGTIIDGQRELPAHDELYVGRNRRQSDIALFAQPADRYSPRIRSFLGRPRRASSAPHVQADRQGRPRGVVAGHTNPVLDPAGKPVNWARSPSCPQRDGKCGQRGMIDAIRRSQGSHRVRTGRHYSGRQRELPEGYGLPTVRDQRTAPSACSFRPPTATGRNISALGQPRPRRIPIGGVQAHRQGRSRGLAAGDLYSDPRPDGDPIKMVKFGTDVTEARMVSANDRGQMQAINRSTGGIEFALDGTVLTATSTFRSQHTRCRSIAGSTTSCLSIPRAGARRIPSLLESAGQRRVPVRRIQANEDGWQPDLAACDVQCDLRSERQAIQGRQVRHRGYCPGCCTHAVQRTDRGLSRRRRISSATPLPRYPRR